MIKAIPKDKKRQGSNLPLDIDKFAYHLLDWFGVV